MLEPKIYKPSDEVVEIISESKILFIAGPSGSGKNTIIKELLKSGKYREIITTTTRKPRINNGEQEKDGIEYHFLSFDKFENLIKKKSLVEYAVVFEDNYYGTDINEFILSNNENKISILDIDVQGVDSFLKINPNIKVIFLLPPSIEILISRIKNRHPDSLDKDKLSKRLNAALDELDDAFNNPKYNLVINDQLDRAIIDTEDILNGKSAREEEKLNLISKLKKEINQTILDTSSTLDY